MTDGFGCGCAVLSFITTLSLSIIIIELMNRQNQPHLIPKNKVKDQLAAIALKEGTVALPDNYTLLDISFLDTIKPSEASDLKAEEAFWAAQKAAGESGQPGSLIHW